MNARRIAQPGNPACRSRLKRGNSATRVLVLRGVNCAQTKKASTSLAPPFFSA